MMVALPACVLEGEKFTPPQLAYARREPFIGFGSSSGLAALAGIKHLSKRILSCRTASGQSGRRSQRRILAVRVIVLMIVASKTPE